ncbi:MAG: helix-turn-helix domain-containing protein [Nostoc sp.]|uniref:helix-turn-helix domain-containing protein n=1 Tax=Nostoc sp. TaxID=1180 RepID=UPI002FFA6AE6
MILGFKTQLKVNQKQQIVLAQHAGTGRHAYNQGLALCKEVLKHNRVNPDDNECDRDWNASINLRQTARSVVSACGLDSADTSRLKQEENLSNC